MAFMHTGVADMGITEFTVVLVVVSSSKGSEVEQSIVKGNRFVYVVRDIAWSVI